MVTGTSALMIMAQSWEDASMPATTMMHVKTNVSINLKHANLIAHARFNTFTSLFYIVLTLSQDNCPAGCPCDDYPCMETTIAPEVTTLTTQATTISPTTNAVLVLSTRYGSNKPMVIDWDGKLIFELEMSSP